jgi:hypothetical protein
VGKSQAFMDLSCRGRAILTGIDWGPSQSCQEEQSSEFHALGEE